MLANMGAEVIRIDWPDGPAYGNPAYDMLPRGKTTLTLNLKSGEGRAAAIGRVRRADAVIENFRPGVMERLGLGPASMIGANPGLVNLSMPGFALTDSAFAEIPAWEGLGPYYRCYQAVGRWFSLPLQRNGLRHWTVCPSFLVC